MAVAAVQPLGSQVRQAEQAAVVVEVLALEEQVRQAILDTAQGQVVLVAEPLLTREVVSAVAQAAAVHLHLVLAAQAVLEFQVVVAVAAVQLAHLLVVQAEQVYLRQAAAVEVAVIMAAQVVRLVFMAAALALTQAAAAAVVCSE